MSAAMSFQPVLLWTDLLLFLLSGSAVLATLHVRANPPLRDAWRRVGKRPTGMAAATILLAFVAVGVLDSLHFRPLLPAFEASSADVTPSGAAEAAAAEAMYSTEVLSLLDHLLAPLRLHTEKTYSAPFAAQLFQREAMELPDGRQLRGYPRLVHGAAHLQQPESEQAADIAQRLARAAGQALLAWLVIFAVLASLVWRGSGLRWGEIARAMLSARTVLAWRAALLTLGAVVLIVAICLELAPLYHVFGTDKVGQDVLYLSLKSVRTALVIGTITTLVMMPFAVALGIAAGYLGGWVDDAVQYL